MRPRLQHLLQVSVAAVALVAPAPAAADEPLAELARDTPVAAYGGALAWSAYDPVSRLYRLVIRQDGQSVFARAQLLPRAFDVSLGPDRRGRVVALYTRCRTPARGRRPERNCDVHRYDLRTRREHRLAAVSSPSFDEAWPAQWREHVTFARRARTRVVDGFDHRPSPRGRLVLDCDIPYVKRLTSRAASRRLDRSQCGATAGMAIRGDTIIHVTGIDQGGAGSESQVRRLRTGGGAARILARTGGGEGGYSPFVSPNLSGSSVWLTRVGRRERVKQGFLRIDLRSRRLTTVAANVNLHGGLARDERGRFWYVQGPAPDFDGESRCDFALEPCRLVAASASPFSTTARTLLPRVSIVAPASGQISAFATDPIALVGELSRPVVRQDAVVGREPLAGVAIDLLRAAGLDRPAPFTGTGISATTNAIGIWSIALIDPPPSAAFALVARGLRLASPVVGIDVSARITLSASGASLTGTVAPAQPGRSVTIQRLAVDANGRLPDGRMVCVKLAGGRLSCGDEAWATVAPAPLGAAGTAFSLTASQPGEYRALLTAERDAPNYGGRSAEVRVAG